LDRVTRHDLKTDKFATGVGNWVQYIAAHRAQAIRYGVAALIVLALGVGFYYFRKSQHDTRQADLSAALRLKDAVVGAPQPGDPRPSFGSQTEKDTAIKKAFESVIAKHGGTNEAAVAHYLLGSMASDAGKTAEAEKEFRAAVAAGSGGYAAVAKLSLAQTLQVEGKNADAEKLLRELIANPTTLVSKEQATFTLVRLLAAGKPDEARKLLEPYEKDSRVAVARMAASLATEIPAKK